MKKVLILLFVFSPLFVTAQSSDPTAELLAFDTDISTEDLTDTERQLLILQLKVLIIRLQERIQSIIDARPASASIGQSVSSSNLNVTESVNISSSINTTSVDFAESLLLNPNSSSVFLQYLDPSVVDQTYTPQTPQVDTTSTSPLSKSVSFSLVPSTVSIGKSYKVNWNQQGFNGFDLVSLEGQSGDIRYFFGSTVPALGSYTITIPSDFKNQPSLTLYLLHNGVVKDSSTLNIQ